MAYPDKYTRQFGFQQYQDTHPDTPAPGDEHDSELDDLAAKISTVIEFLKKSLRSDGKLANRSVGVDQLAADLSIGFHEPTMYAAGAAYSVNDTVFYVNGFYQCKTAHVATDTFNTDYWTLLVDFSAQMGAAAASAAAAAVSEGNAAASEAAAAASETAAASSASAASTSETNAASSASAASTSETNAAASASAASTSETNAAASAASATASAAALSGTVLFSPHWVASVKTAPTGAEADGVRYLVAHSGTTGTFVGHEDNVAQKVAGAWVFSGTPGEGERLYVQDSDRVYAYLSTGVWKIQKSRLIFLSDWPTLATADAFAKASGRRLVIDEDVTLTADTTLTADQVKFDGGIITRTNSWKLRFNGNVQGSFDQYFDTDTGGQWPVVFDKGLSDITPQMWGAKGDGVGADVTHFDRYPLQAFLNQFAVIGGTGRMRGVYKVDTRLTLIFNGGTDNRNWCIDGNNAVIKPTSGISALDITALTLTQGAELKNLVIDHTASDGTTVAGVRFYGAISMRASRICVSVDTTKVAATYAAIEVDQESVSTNGSYWLELDHPIVFSTVGYMPAGIRVKHNSNAMTATGAQITGCVDIIQHVGNAGDPNCVTYIDTRGEDFTGNFFNFIGDGTTVGGAVKFLGYRIEPHRSGLTYFHATNGGYNSNLSFAIYEMGGAIQSPPSGYNTKWNVPLNVRVYSDASDARRGFDNTTRFGVVDPGYAESFTDNNGATNFKSSQTTIVPAGTAADVFEFDNALGQTLGRNGFSGSIALVVRGMTTDTDKYVAVYDVISTGNGAAETFITNRQSAIHGTNPISASLTPADDTGGPSGCAKFRLTAVATQDIKVMVTFDGLVTP